MLKKQYLFMWAGFGLSNLGGWIYLIALNLSIWELTHSPLAVSILYVIGPVARILSSFFAGSVVDRRNKRSILIWSFCMKALIVFCMPFLSVLWGIYALVFISNTLNSFTNPSITYMKSVLVADVDRKRFNAIYSMLSSGLFMIGPAISGVLIAATSISVAMWVNSILLLAGALIIAQLPAIAAEDEEGVNQKLSFKMLREDFSVVAGFIRQPATPRYFLIMYSIVLMIAFSLDSQEMSFLKDFHQVSNASYGVIVGITGVGAIVGGFLSALFANRIHVNTYIGAGLFGTLMCYFIFYFSPNLYVGLVAFVLLGLFMAFSNTGYATQYQTIIPTRIMGRFGNALSLAENVLQIVLTIVIGVLAGWYSIPLVTSIAAGVGVIAAASLYWHLARHRGVGATQLVED